MQVINLDDYDLSYDIQYMEFMVKLLQPYITFKYTGSQDHSRPVMDIYRNINEGISQKFTLEGYIHFIQCIFPQMIQSEIKEIKEELNYEESKQDILRSQRKKKPMFKLPMFMEADIEDKCNIFVEEVNSYNVEELKLEKEQNKKKLNDLLGKIRYLEKVQEINRERNGSIKDVIYLFENIHFMYLGNKDNIDAPHRT